MSNARPNPAAEINLEEFERRLRASAAPQPVAEDPLAELTRLVDTIGFERTPSERALEATRAPKAAAKPAPAPTPPAPPPATPSAPTPPAPPAPPQSGEILPPDEAPVEFTPRFEAAAGPILRPSFGEEEHIKFAPTSSARVEVVEPVVMAPPAASRPRGRNWTLKVGGLVAASVVMIAAVAVFKVGRGVHSGEPPLILASTAPTKVAPPSEETVRTANETGNLLTRDTAQPTPTPPKLVAPPEAPVDLAARPQPAATGEASPVAPSASTPIVASPPAIASPAAPVGLDPNRVKTISVRPDGTLISSGFEANAAASPSPSPAPSPAPSPTAQAALDAEAATPEPALPTKLSPPKSGARVVSKSDTTAPADQGDGPVPVKAKKPKPTPSPTPVVADAEPKTDDAAAADAGAGGGYSVQFAAPNNRADAEELVKKAQARYTDAIGGASLGVRVADRKGQKIFRVRALGLTKAQAQAMCGKIKTAGGDCFIAKN